MFGPAPPRRGGKRSSPAMKQPPQLKAASTPRGRPAATHHPHPDPTQRSEPAMRRGKPTAAPGVAARAGLSWGSGSELRPPASAGPLRAGFSWVGSRRPRPPSNRAGQPHTPTTPRDKTKPHPPRTGPPRGSEDGGRPSPGLGRRPPPGLSSQRARPPQQSSPSGQRSPSNPVGMPTPAMSLGGQTGQHCAAALQPPHHIRETVRTEKHFPQTVQTHHKSLHTKSDDRPTTVRT
jgi:hypothetical protein